MVLINSNQIQVVLLERAQAHNSQGSANLTAGTACTYGWACAHRKVKILTQKSCKQMVLYHMLQNIACAAALLLLCAHVACQPRHSAEA